jgi:hypothetical protein
MIAIQKVQVIIAIAEEWRIAEAGSEASAQVGKFRIYDPFDPKEMEQTLKSLPSPYDKKIIEAIEALSKEEQLDLLALSVLGRGIRHSFNTARQLARSMGATDIADYLTEMPNLDQILADGLKKQ